VRILAEPARPGWTAAATRGIIDPSMVSFPGSPPGAPSREPTPRVTVPAGGWNALAIVTVAFACGSLAVLSVAPLSPFLVEAFRLSRAQVGLLLPAVYLGGVLMSLPSGWLTDQLGVRLVLGGGLAVLGVLMALAAGVSAFVPLLACLVLAGFGFSVLNPATGKAIVDWFPPRRRGAAMGVKQTGLTLGGIVGSLTLPPLAQAYGWRVAVLAAAGAAVLMAVVVGATYRRPAVAAAATSLPRVRLAEVGRYFRRPAIVLVLVSGFLLSMAQSSLLGYLVLFANETFAFSAIAAAQLLALAQIGGTAGRLAWGFLSDRFFGGRRRPGIVINALLGAVSYSLFALGDGLDPSLLIPLALAAGAGAFGWVGLYFALVAEIGGARHAGVLTGVAVSFSWSGVLVGPPLFGIVLEASGSYTRPWLVLAAIAVAVAAALPWPGPLVQRD
jgi:MFS transporter, ACS family, hexuronate transporter